MSERKEESVVDQVYQSAMDAVKATPGTEDERRKYYAFMLSVVDPKDAHDLKLKENVDTSDEEAELRNERIEDFLAQEALKNEQISTFIINNVKIGLARQASGDNAREVDMNAVDTEINAAVSAANNIYNYFKTTTIVNEEEAKEYIASQINNLHETLRQSPTTTVETVDTDSELSVTHRATEETVSVPESQVASFESDSKTPVRSVGTHEPEYVEEKPQAPDDGINIGVIPEVDANKAVAATPESKGEPPPTSTDVDEATPDENEQDIETTKRNIILRAVLNMFSLSWPRKDEALGDKGINVNPVEENETVQYIKATKQYITQLERQARFMMLCSLAYSGASERASALTALANALKDAIKPIRERQAGLTYPEDRLSSGSSLSSILGYFWPWKDEIGARQENVAKVQEVIKNWKEALQGDSSSNHAYQGKGVVFFNEDSSNKTKFTVDEKVQLIVEELSKGPKNS